MRLRNRILRLGLLPLQLLSLQLLRLQLLQLLPALLRTWLPALLPVLLRLLLLRAVVLRRRDAGGFRALLRWTFPPRRAFEVNGYATKSKGVNRSYVCRGLAYGEPYVLNMVVTANGVATRKALTIHAGESRHVAFSETLAAR